MFGCCGSVQQSRLFLGLYMVATFVLLIFTLSAGIYLLYKKDGVCCTSVNFSPFSWTSRFRTPWTTWCSITTKVRASSRRVSTTFKQHSDAVVRSSFKSNSEIFLRKCRLWWFSRVPPGLPEKLRHSLWRMSLSNLECVGHRLLSRACRFSCRHSLSGKLLLALEKVSGVGNLPCALYDYSTKRGGARRLLHGALQPGFPPLTETTTTRSTKSHSRNSANA